ncbi:MAG: glycosyltransferase, partial [Longimicrobiales bacterium]
LLDVLGDDDVEIFTLVHVPGAVSARIEAVPIHTSFVDRLPGARARHRFYLPLFPSAVERFDLRRFDLVISSSHCIAKGARPPEDVPHLCYCHTPMRYIWDQYDAYFGYGHGGRALRRLAPPLTGWLRRWDVATCARVDSFVASSVFVGDRIRRCWEREAAVVNPPVDIDRFSPAVSRDEFYLIVSALVAYKRIDLAVNAFNRLGRRLVVVGDGPELPRLQNRANANILFRGRLPDEEIAQLMARCRAFVLPGEEDFGIAAVEAQAAGAPVIALGSGGALETVIGAAAGHEPPPDATGVFFSSPDADALARAVERFETLEFDPGALRASASRFTRGRFMDRMRLQIACALHDR